MSRDRWAYEVDRGGDDFNVFERELGPLSQKITVHKDHAASIKVHASSITALIRREDVGKG